MSNCNGVEASRLLSLPREVLSQILDFILNAHHIKVSEDGRMCNVPGVVGTCRTLFHEANFKLCSASLINFTSSEALLTFHALRTAAHGATGCSLSGMRNVSVECGAAKHAPSKVRISTLTALRLLADKRHSLRRLDLRVSYFYQAATLDIPMASKLIKAIGKFKDLSDLTISMGPPPPGPFDCHSTEPDSLKKLSARIHAMETVFRRYTCHPAERKFPWEVANESGSRQSLDSFLPRYPPEFAQSNNFVTRVKLDVIHLLQQSGATGMIAQDTQSVVG